jgi:hypothetical protein
MSRTNIATALRVAQSLLQGVELKPEQAEQQFGLAYGIFFELYASVIESADTESGRMETAIIISDYARSVLRSEMSLEAAKLATSETVKIHSEIDFGFVRPTDSTPTLDRLILQSETEILKVALRVRRTIEQLPLGQDITVASEYVMTLICDQARRYSIAKAQGLTEIDGYHIFIATVPVVTDIALEGWGRLGNTYYNPGENVFTLAYVKAQMSDFKTYLEAYDMGIGEKVSGLMDETATYIYQVADKESQRFDCISARDQHGVCIGIAKHLIAISQRAWRLCINNLISDVDDLLADESKALKWLESENTPIDTDTLIRALERIYMESTEFSSDADIDLESLDAIVVGEFSLTVQAADAMVEEMSPWTMS